MRFRAADLRPHGWASAPDAPDPGLVRVQHGVPAGADWRRLVAACPDLGPRSDAESLAGLRARRPVLGEGHMILRLTPKTAVGLLG